ncbi:glycosyltransferase [Pseudomonas sp. Marseille-Q5115]|uniref:glycosyltransferase n=1 Tax=Pseudomonas sp. Marseille-Q5115 TaxID=2866593 RepID=UPI001CE3C258|nr:glycosyltransferase [Pseudomonas sp. Marseille-Q5115]
MSEASQYILDDTTGVWARPGYLSIPYSDGDTAEEYVWEVVRNANDLSALSVELAGHARDWASLYHLSPARGNILRPFEAQLNKKVLEIGAGCGAISRFLGECGGQVLCLEGSVRRARTAASRTRDLSNVTVLAERFDDFETTERFDVVTLIGVLEYASMFSTAPDPALHMLQRAGSLLRPGGRLFIAIENQLGLKYFAGAPEDHLGLPMYGIEGRYGQGQPKTFGRKVLASLLKEAGFAVSEFLAPIPDYKIPQTIITEHGITHSRFDAASLIGQSVGRDPQLPDDTHFDLHRTWPEVLHNGLGLELANSFLVCATLDPGSHCIPASDLAYHYSTGRKPSYCKEARFVESEGQIEVRYRPLAPLEESPEQFKYELPAVATYKEGTLLSSRFVELSGEPDWSVEGFAEFLRSYINVLQELAAEVGDPPITMHLHHRLSGIFIDAVPSNIIMEASGKAAFIDREWRKPDGIELGHLLVRALLLLLATKSPLLRPDLEISRFEFITCLFSEVGLSISRSQIDSFVEQEARLQEIVTGRHFTEFLDWGADKELADQASADPQTGASAKLYWAADSEGFTEGESLAVALTEGVNTLSWVVPANASAACHVLRFDPIDKPGVFTMEELMVKAGESVVWEWDGDLQSLSAVVGLFTLLRPDGLVSLLAVNADPRLQIPLPTPNVIGEPLQLSVTLTLHQDSDFLATYGHSEESFDEPVGGETMAEGAPGREANAGKESAMSPVSGEYAPSAGADSANTPLSGFGDIAGVSELREEVARLRAELEVSRDALTAQQIAKDTHIHNLNLRIIGLEGSTSWLVTAPLRKGVITMRRARRIASLLPSIARRGGGWEATCRKAIAVLRSHGVSGVIARLRHVIQMGTPEFIGHESRPVPDRHDYQNWVSYYDTLDDDKRWRMKEEVRRWQKKPLVSIIMPVYNPPIALLNEAIESVRRQLYPQWELCIADDASTDGAVADVLRGWMVQDPRIKVIFRERNGHISQASNSALSLAEGEYIALMDNDDLLAEHALYWAAKAIQDNPTAKLFYSDEDKIDEAGRRSSPYFKPSWNKFLFRSQNMICHLGIYQTALVQELNGFREGYEGSQDYDLALRCIDRLERNQIVHIPRVLYHWRIHRGSTALAGNEKPYAALAGLRALKDHLERNATSGEVELLPTGMYRVHYTLPENPPSVSVIIPTRNAHQLVRQCIESITRLTSYKHYEIILIDNGSDDSASLEYFISLEALDNVRVIRDDRPFNYSALNNHAVNIAKGDVIALVNNDIEVITPEWLDEMVALATQPGIGAVGARLWYPDNRLQHGGVVVGVGGVAGHSHKYLPRGDHGYFCRSELIQEFSAVTAACLVVRKAIFQEAGGLDEENLVIAFNDVDFCLRLQELGYVNVWTPYAELYHHESATRGLEDTPAKKARFAAEVNYMKRRWPQIQEDYCYNPNLTLDHEDFGLSWPPRVKI